MTQYNKLTLTTFFATGDNPDGTDYANFIDSCVNQIETADQPIAGPISPTKLNTARISAGNVNVTGSLMVSGAFNFNGGFSAATITANTLTVGGNLSSGSLTVTAAISAASLNVTGDVSAATGTVYASAIHTGAGIFRAVTVVSAAGTTQATGASLGSNGVIRLKGIADGTTTGFVLLANQTGNQQTIWVEENTSCNLWPCVGGQINALSSNAAFPMAGNTQYIVTHIKASGYAVK